MLSLTIWFLVKLFVIS